MGSMSHDQINDGFSSTAGGPMSSYALCIRGSKRCILTAATLTKENKNPQLSKTNKESSLGQRRARSAQGLGHSEQRG